MSLKYWKWYLIAIAMLVYCFMPATAQAGNSWQGTIQTVTTTVVTKNQPDANQYIGAGAGAAVGYGIGRLIFGKTAGIIGGGLGMVAGSAMSNSNDAWTIVVNLQDNTKQTIIQRKDKFPQTEYKVGDRVTVVNLNGEYLVVK